MLFPLRIIRLIIDEEEISFKSNKKSELVDVLIEEVTWADERVEELEERYLEFREAESALGNWVSNLESCPDLQELANQLTEKSEAEFDDGVLVESGWQVTEVDGGVARLNKWKYEENQEYDRLSGSVQESTERSSTSVEIDTNENTLRIEASNYQRAKGIRNTLREMGLDFGPLGHGGLHPDNAKERVEGLVDDLESQLQDIDQEVQDA